MNHPNKTKLFFAAIVSTISMACWAQSAPSEATSITIQRSASQSIVSGLLKKNLYKTETYQAPYTVQVPYQDTETYTVEVPYEVEVPYTDYETDYRYEEQCDTVTRYRDEYRCETVTKYRSEYRCEDRTRYRQECRDEQKCYIVPGTGGGQQCHDVTECGTNAQGQQICKTRRVCEDTPGSGPQQRCETQRVCENVPYTDRDCNYVNVPYTEQECQNVRIPYTDRECRMVNVPYQKPVTRYRTETRYKTETRTRTVTKYRDEQRCCETKTREVFDRQEQVAVEIEFPTEAALVNGETETFQVDLNAIKPASVTVKALRTIYGYKQISQTATAQGVLIKLVAIPKYNSQNAGEASVTGFKLSYSAQLKRFVAVVEDSIQDDITLNRLETTATVAFHDLATEQLIEEIPVSTLLNGKKGAVLQTELSAKSKLKATLKVLRKGTLVEQGSLQFSKISIYDKKAIPAEAVASLSAASNVTLKADVTTGQAATMLLMDSTEEFDDVTTTYNVNIMELLADDQRKTLAKVTLSREQLNANQGTLKLAELLGAKAKDGLKSGKSLRLHVEIVRNSESDLIKQPIKLTVKASIKIK